MFRMIRGVVGLAILAALGYAAVTIPLGDRTLWGHVKAIADSKEGKKLVDGVKTKADEVLKKGDPEKKGAPASRPTDSDKLTPREQRALKELIRERLAKKVRRAAPKGQSAEAPAKKLGEPQK